jgi:hypothetical protein
MKPPAIALSWAERGLGGDNGGDLTNVQRKAKAIRNCHNESPRTTNIS